MPGCSWEHSVSLRSVGNDPRLGTSQVATWLESRSEPISSSAHANYTFSPIMFQQARQSRFVLGDTVETIFQVGFTRFSLRLDDIAVRTHMYEEVYDSM